MTVVRPSRTRVDSFASLDAASELLAFEDAAGPTFIVVSGPAGSGKLDTVRAWISNCPNTSNTIFADGDKESHGYFAGFLPLIEAALISAEIDHPACVAAAEQSLKRLFPNHQSASYRVPQDLTGSAGREERTRFYHHEYQTKLLNGVYEFLLDYLTQANLTYTLVIDNAHRLSPTSTRFLDIIARRRDLSGRLSIILLTDVQADVRWFESGAEVQFRPMGKSEARFLVDSWGFPEATPKQFDSRWLLAQGNPARLAALYECATGEVDLPEYLTFETHLDLYLGQLDQRARYELLTEFIAGHCADDSPIAVRNYQTADAGTRERLHRSILTRLAGTVEEVMHPVHQLGLESAADRVVALAPLSIALQEIGLYDTWFDLFSRFWPDSQLRTLPGGGELHNLAFLRMAFVLYSLGLAPVSIRYLDTFYHQFPRSFFTPTVLYSQSMAHGRYQTPPDLEAAERYALLNLDKIDGEFTDHPKHEYIKVFAENALAYIRARQGRLDEALELCTRGLDRMNEIYGDARFSLHQSILMYNTGQIYELTRNFPKAYETYLQTIELDPNYGEYANDMANLLQNHGREEEALHYYDRAIELCPPYYEAYLNRAQLHARMGSTEEAERDYLRVLELMPGEPRAHHGLGVLHLEQGDSEQALQFLDAAVYNDAKNFEAWNNRGLALASTSQLAESEASLRTAIALRPSFSEAWNNLAQTLYLDSRLDESLHCLTTAIDIADDADYRYNRAVLSLELGHFAGGESDISAAEMLGADPEDIRELKERLAKERGA